jgi:cytochrome c551/c552
VSPDFPQVGTGGRNAMAGPVYYTDLYPKESRLPDYFNGKLFTYDWIRGWIKVVTMLPNGDFDKMEPFIGNIKLNSLIDMETGPDGRLYLLEYGSGWFSKNPDAGLARLDFNAGNRPPVITAMKVDKSSGTLPLSIKATVEAKDPEKDKVTYIWNLGNGTTKETTTPELDYTYTTIGDYSVFVTVKDKEGASSKSDVAAVYAGNEAPVVSINLAGGNKSFYMPGVPLKYDVSVNDKDDSSKIDPANLFVSVDYVEGYDKAAASPGHQQGQAKITGKNLMLSLDCKSCHNETEKSVGPAYMQVSEKYQKDKDAVTYLSQKIIKGGAGVWGEVAMPAHPDLSQANAKLIASWVLSLADKTVKAKSLPASGSIIPPAAPAPAKGPASMKPAPTLVLSATYIDKGGNNIKALPGNNSVSLRSNMISFTGTEKTKGFTPFKAGGADILRFPSGEGWFAVDDIDLTGVASINLITGWQGAPETGFSFEARLDAPDGKVLGKGSMPTPAKGQQFGTVKLPVEAVSDRKMHSIYLVYKSHGTFTGGVVSVQFNPK